jgi:hypothetical protein
MSFPRKWESSPVSSTGCPCPRQGHSRAGSNRQLQKVTGFPLPDQVEDKLRGKPWIPAGVYPGENRGRNDNMEIGFEF